MKKNSGPLQYAALVRKVINSRYRLLLSRGYDMDDLMQEGLLVIFNASRDYDPDRGGEISYFARCVDNYLYKLVRATESMRAIPSRMVISLDAMSECNASDEPTGALSETLADERASAEIDTLIDRLSPNSEPTLTESMMAYLRSVDPQAARMVQMHCANGETLASIQVATGHYPKNIGRRVKRGIRLIREHFNINVGGTHETE